MSTIKFPKKQQPKKLNPKETKRKPKPRRRRPAKAMESQKVTRQIVNKTANQLSAASRGLSYKYSQYLHALLNPEDAVNVRMPDEVTMPTATYKSVRRFNISLDLTGNPQGAFAILVQPKLGIYQALQKFETSSVSISIPQCSDINDITQYTSYDDPNSDALFCPPPTVYQYAGSNLNAINSLPPYQAAFFPASGLGDTNLSQAWLPGSSSLIKWANYTPPNGIIQVPSALDSSGNVVAPFVFNNANTGFITGWFSGLSGWVDLQPFLISRSATLAVGQTSVMLFERVGGSVTGWTKSQSATADCWGGTFLDPEHFYQEKDWTSILHAYDWPSAIVGAGQSVIFNNLFRINANPKASYCFLFYVPATYPLPVGSIIQGLQIHTIPFATTYPTNSLATTIRPVACSALLHPTSAAAATGGEVIALSLPSGATYETWSADRTFSGLSTLNFERGSKSSDSKRGAYAFWAPFSVSDRQFRGYQESLDYDYGSLILAGNVTNAMGTSTTVMAFTLTVTTHYEYMSTSRLITTIPCRGSLEYYSLIMDRIGEIDRCYENKTHLEELAKIMHKSLFPIVKMIGGDKHATNFNKFMDNAIGVIGKIPGLESLEDLVAIVSALM